MVFFCGNRDTTITRQSTCCFNHYIGLPEKKHIIGFQDILNEVTKRLEKKPILESRTHTIYDYQFGQYEYQGELHQGLFQLLETELFLWIKKATGMGATEFLLRYIAWKALSSDTWKGYQCVIITGARVQIGIDLISRIRGFFPEILFDEKETVCNLNGCKIECYPSNHSDTIRGLPKVCFILVDEGDFFSPKEQKLVRDSVERYIGKNSPPIVWISTPNLPDGLFDRMEKEKSSIYFRIFWHYIIGLDKIYLEKEIELAKKSPSFPREYELEYGIGLGNLFPDSIVKFIIQDYDLRLSNGRKILFLDPAWGSSKFGILGIEFINGIGYVKHCEQRDRPSPEAIFERLKELHQIGWSEVVCDGAQTVVINFLDANSITNQKIMFKDKLDDMVDRTLECIRDRTMLIHTGFTELRHQLVSINMNEKGHPDKKKITFDEGDCFMMGCLENKESSDFSGSNIGSD
ncbi:terminase large subunit [Nitrososphaeria virus YSH_1032793]|uniref:Terminase large subunit n=1 Tax=Nitrososphaeria virus YSH_1032793 TaxID=3071320 RepID=A0A976UAE7_9CAUD|nr:terminase large subunit [Yangshan Harbor Nitrososphaeria virus]UVF62252.1 terminase large subunit [Nitrososphaeria virus YSH_1032793]